MNNADVCVYHRERERRVSEESARAPETRSAEDSGSLLNLGWIWKMKKIGPLDFGAIFPYTVQLLSLTDPTT